MTKREFLMTSLISPLAQTAIVRAITQHQPEVVYESGREFFLRLGYLELGCPKCRYINYRKPDEEMVCWLCHIPLLSVQECEAIIVAEYHAKNQTA